MQERREAGVQDERVLGELAVVDRQTDEERDHAEADRVDLRLELRTRMAAAPEVCTYVVL